MSQLFAFVLYSSAGNEHAFSVPGKFEVCPRCDGTGKHDHPAFSNGITSSEWNGHDWDDESRESYLRGTYDVQCTECDGKRVVIEPNLTACSRKQLALLHLFEAAERQHQHENNQERWLRYHESGCMG